MPPTASEKRCIMKRNRYEVARLIGARALQIGEGAPSYVHYTPVAGDDPVRIALEEYIEGIMPLDVSKGRVK